MSTNVHNALDDIILIFREECAQFLDIMRDGAAALLRGDIDAEMLALLRRAVHSAKGGAGALGYRAFHLFSSQLEDVLDALRAGEIDAAGPARAVVASAVGVMALHIATVTMDGPVPDDADILAALRALLKPAERVSPSDDFGFAPLPVDVDYLDAIDGDDDDAPWRVRFIPAAADLAKGREPLLLVRELVRMGGELYAPDLSDLPPLDALDPTAAHVCWTILLPAGVSRAAIEECLDFVSPQARITIARDHDWPLASAAVC